MRRGSKQPRYSLEEFIEACKEKHQDKYDYSKTVYTGSRDKITIICPIHGEFEQNAAHHKAGRGCPECYNDKRKSGNIIDIPIKSLLIDNGFQLLTEYFSLLYNGKIQIKNNSEIYIPDLNLVFEYNYINQQVNKNYCLNKTNECLEKGIRLIHIFEDEWLLKTDLVKSKIKHLLKLDTVKIPTRKCVCHSISLNEAKDFLDKYHIQGNVFSTVNLGLTYNNDLVAVMTFNKPRFNTAYDWELIRYAVKSDISLPGGASKLLKSFRENYSGSIISYADKRWSLGNLYNILGFKELEDSPPNYFYVKGNSLVRESRYKFQKHLLKDKLSVFDPDLSEYDNMKNNGYSRVWDCGNKVYILN